MKKKKSTSQAGSVLFNLTGPISLLFSFLPQIQQIKMQGVNRRTYQITLESYMKTVDKKQRRQAKNLMDLGQNLEPNQAVRSYDGVRILGMTGYYFGELKWNEKGKPEAHGVGVLRGESGLICGNFDSGELLQGAPFFEIQQKRKHAGIFFTAKGREETFKYGYLYTQAGYKQHGALFTGIFDKERQVCRCEVRLITTDPYLQINLERVKFTRYTYDFQIQHESLGEHNYDGKLHGKGIRIYPSGSIDIGHWTNGKGAAGKIITVYSAGKSFGQFQVGEGYIDRRLYWRGTKYNADGTFKKFK